MLVKVACFLAGGPDSFTWLSSSASNDGYTFLINSIFSSLGKSAQTLTPSPVLPIKWQTARCERPLNTLLQ